VLNFTRCCLKTLPLESLRASIIDEIVETTGATNIQVGENLQALWGGYGGIIRLHLEGVSHSSAILKLIEPPHQPQHPRGWNTLNSHRRKLRSYEIETHWYNKYAKLCSERCRVPLVFIVGNEANCQWILMEDLTTHYPLQASTLSLEQASICLLWLANFHAQFIGQAPDGLWPKGTYWHLDTRQDELNSMPEGELKTSAALIDKVLGQCPYQSFVHGDAKVANFCFNSDASAVAAVDFQYVGGGVGVKDVVYFLGSCLDEDVIEQNETALLAVYFDELVEQITASHSAEMAEQVALAWSSLYAIAWTDFYRFLEGWMPGHSKINQYTKSLAIRAFDQLKR